MEISNVKPESVKEIANAIFTAFTLEMELEEAKKAEELGNNLLDYLRERGITPRIACAGLAAAIYYIAGASEKLGPAAAKLN
jgi:hypothetical protein